MIINWIVITNFEDQSHEKYILVCTKSLLFSKILFSTKKIIFLYISKPMSCRLFLICYSINLARLQLLPILKSFRFGAHLKNPRKKWNFSSFSISFFSLKILQISVGKKKQVKYYRAFLFHKYRQEISTERHDKIGMWYPVRGIYFVSIFPPSASSEIHGGWMDDLKMHIS